MRQITLEKSVQPFRRGKVPNKHPDIYTTQLSHISLIYILVGLLCWTCYVCIIREIIHWSVLIAGWYNAYVSRRCVENLNNT